MVAQHRQKHPALEIRAKRVPVDVEIGGEWRFLTPFQDIEPPNIVAPDTHMIGDEIEDQTHPMGMKGIDERPKLRLCPDFRVELVVINDVVTMRRTGACLRDRRGIDMADAESGEVRHQIRGVAKSELAMELQSIGGAYCSEAVGQSAHSAAERRRSSLTILAARCSEPPARICSSVWDKWRHQFGCA